MPRTTIWTFSLPPFFTSSSSSSTSKPATSRSRSRPGSRPQTAITSKSPSKSATTTRPSSSWYYPSRSRRPSHTQPPPTPVAQPHPPHPDQIHPLLIDNDEALLSRARDFARAHMSHYDSSHDWPHVERVVALSRQIYAQLPRDMIEKRGYNTTLIELAALLHDICDHKYLDKTVALVNGAPSAPPPPAPPPPQAQPSRDQQQHPGLSTSPGPEQHADINPPQPQTNPKPTMPAAKPPQPHTTTQTQTTTPAALLHQTLRNPPLLIPAALALPLEEIILHVSYSTEIRAPAAVRAVLARHPELEIVQDADRLDALGAIGVGRCFTYGATQRCEAQRLLAGDGGGGGSGEGGAGAEASSNMADSLIHFDKKLLRLEAMMKTAPGKKMARERSDRIRTFKRWWQEEAGIVEYGTVDVSRR